MVRPSSYLLLAAFAMVAVPGDTLRAQTPPQPQQGRVFRGTTNLVLVDVYPQRDGRIVEGLTREDFEVFENNAPQAIERVEFIRVEPHPPDVVRRDPNSQREALAAVADPYARVFVVLLDTLHTTIAGSHDVRRPLIDTLNRLVTVDDLFGVLTQNERATDLVLGRVLNSIDDQLRTNWAWGERHSLVESADILIGLDDADPMELFLDVCFSTKIVGHEIVPWYIDDGEARRLFSAVLIERRREDRVISSLENLVSCLGEIRNARTTLMVVTDGWLWFPVDRPLAEHLADTEAVPLPPGAGQRPVGGLPSRDPQAIRRDDCNQELMRLTELDNPRRLRTLIDDARRRSVSIYPINPAGLATDDVPLSVRTQPSRSARPGEVVERFRNRLRDRVEGLRTLAEGTDAFAVVDTNDIASGLQRIAEDVSAYYLLGYTSTHTEPDGQYRTIRVNVRPPGLHVRARRGYRAATAASVLAPDTMAAPDEETEAREAAFARLARVRRSCSAPRRPRDRR